MLPAALFSLLYYVLISFCSSLQLPLGFSLFSLTPVALKCIWVIGFTSKISESVFFLSVSLFSLYSLYITAFSYT